MNASACIVLTNHKASLKTIKTAVICRSARHPARKAARTDKVAANAQKSSLDRFGTVEEVAALAATHLKSFKNVVGVSVRLQVRRGFRVRPHRQMIRVESSAHAWPSSR
jgi:hypothetical protein